MTSHVLRNKVCLCIKLLKVYLIEKVKKLRDNAKIMSPFKLNLRVSVRLIKMDQNILFAILNNQSSSNLVQLKHSGCSWFPYIKACHLIKHSNYMWVIGKVLSIMLINSFLTKCDLEKMATTCGWDLQWKTRPCVWSANGSARALYSSA